VVSAGRRPVAERQGVEGVHEAVVDSTDEASVRALFESVGELDHLLVTASPGQSGVFLEQDLALARTFMDGKFFGSWTCARYAAPLLRSRGSITFVTGGGGGPPQRREVDDHRGIRRRRGLDACSGRRARAASSQRDPAGLHRQ
jgi:hypothetical protein